MQSHRCGTASALTIYSGIFFFFKPHRDKSAGPLSCFVTEDNPFSMLRAQHSKYPFRMTKILY